MTQPEARQRSGFAVEESIDPTFIRESEDSLRPILVGDGIENPGNVAALREVASMFAWDCGFLGASRRDPPHAAGHPQAPTLSWGDLAASGAPIIALENTEDADDLYGFQPPRGARLVLVVGNERKGITREILSSAYRTIRIPVASRQINTVNVAAAAAIALFYLSHGGRGRLRMRPDPNRSRPELLIAGPTDPIELGSVIRSAAAFGWGRVLVDDSNGVWFGTDRVTRSLGRGAARRGRNGIHVVPANGGRCGGFEEACIVTTAEDGEPLDRADLARGPGQLIVIPDQSGGLPTEQELGRLARRIRRVRIDLPRSDVSLAGRLRLIASIALAEVARQVGTPKRLQLRQKPSPRTQALSAIDLKDVEYDRNQ